MRRACNFRPKAYFGCRYAPVHGVHTENTCIDVVNPVANDVKIRGVILAEVYAVHDLNICGFALYGYVSRIFRGMGFVFLLLGTDSRDLSLTVFQQVVGCVVFSSRR